MYFINFCSIFLIIFISNSIGEESEYDSIKCKLARALQNQDVDKKELRSRKHIFKI